MYQGKSRYQHVNVLCEMNQVSWELAKIADKELKTTSCCGDWMDALAIALDVIHKAIEAGTEYEKTQIVLFSPFCSPFITSAKTESAFIDALITRETELLVVSSIFEKGSESLTDGGEVALRLTKQVLITNKFCWISLWYMFGYRWMAPTSASKNCWVTCCSSPIHQ